MSRNNLPRHDTAKALDLQAIAGVDKHLGNVASVTILGVSLTPMELKAALQGELDALLALESVRAEVKQVLATVLAARVKARDTRAGLRTYLLSAFGPQAIGVLHDFGMSPKTRSPQAAQTRANAVVKARATRKARHTMGKKQKQAIKGDITPPAEPTA